MGTESGVRAKQGLAGCGGLPHLRMAVNVSAKQFWGGRIVDTVRRVLKEMDLPPSDLELEITESVFLRDIEETVRTLSELRSMGVAISLDDFGNGYSSLNYLRRLPIDQLKIDGSFIRDLSANPNAAVLLSQIIQLGHAMHLEVVAECVETEAEYAFLTDNDCDVVQGYYLHKPLSSTVLGQLLKERCGGHAPTAERTMTRQMPDTREAYRIV
jgi:EAL domain-containing protein (putative c-di-GMP-specific phosphodiesterase class I)